MTVEPWSCISIWALCCYPQWVFFHSGCAFSSSPNFCIWPFRVEPRLIAPIPIPLPVPTQWIGSCFAWSLRIARCLGTSSTDLTLSFFDIQESFVFAAYEFGLSKPVCLVPCWWVDLLTILLERNWPGVIIKLSVCGCEVGPLLSHLMKLYI